VRELPAEEGKPKPEPKEEELLKTTADIPQDVLIAIRQLQGREGKTKKNTSISPKGNTWREVENTTRFGNQWHIGRNDERSFRDPDEFFSSVYVDTYVSKTSKLRGLSVRNIQPKLAAKYGVQAGDVLIQVNGRAVTSKGQAVNMVKKAYKRGVRTFTTKWLSNGQEVERVYQAPNKK
jgi:type II secretory pathway component PulC